MSNVKPYYGDPSNIVDTLHKLERRQEKGCLICRNCLGKAFGLDVCQIGKAPDMNGWCNYWKEKMK